jgi:hypothetical protein
VNQKNNKRGVVREEKNPNKTLLNTKKYLEKSTIIMCNPNALIY